MARNYNSSGVGRDFTEGPVVSQLIKFMLPMMLTSLLQQLYSMADLAIIGQFVGSTGTVGVSTGGELNDIVLPFATALSYGGQIYLAQLYGAKEEGKKDTAVKTLLTLMLILSGVSMAIGFGGCDIILRFLNCPEEAYSQARSYMLITAIGIPFTGIYNALGALMRSRGESKKPLNFVMVSSCVNIVLNLLLVVVFNMEAAGVAIATVVSQLTSVVMCLIYMGRHKDVYGIELNLSFLKIDRDAAVIILKIAIPQAVRSFLVRFSGVYVRSRINAYGLTYSATHSVGNKIEKFLDLYANAVSNSTAAMLGQNLGAKKHDRAKEIVRASFKLALCFAAVTVLCAILLPVPLFKLFSNDPEVWELGKTYLRIMTVNFILTAIVNPHQAMIVASGNATLNLVIGILDGVVFKIGLGLIFAELAGMGAVGYWWGITFSRLIPAVIVVWYFHSGKWKYRDITNVRIRGAR